MNKVKVSVLTLIIVLMAGLLAACGNEVESAEDFPSQEIEMIIPWSPGGGSDLEGRFVTEHGSNYIDTDIVPVNVPGVGGTVGMEELAEKDANGYSIGQIHEGHLVAHHSGVSDINYDDFKPIAAMTSAYQFLAVSDDLGVDTLDEFVEYGQNNTVQFGGTVAGIPRVWVEQIGQVLGIDYNLVGYEGTAEAIQALAGGHIEASIVDYPSAKSFAEAGDIKFIAVGTDERIDDVSDIPTFKENGYDLEMAINRGYVAPIDTPDEIIEKLEKVLEETSQDEAYIEAVEQTGGIVNFRGSEDYMEYLEGQDQIISDIMAEITDE